MKNIFIIFAVFAVIGNVSAQNNVGIGTSLPEAKLDINGALALREGTPLSLSSPGVQGGANDNIVLPYINLTTDVASFYRITGPSGAFSVFGIAAGADGQVVTLVNTSGKAMTIVNNNSSTSVNGIITQTGANITDNASATANSSITLQYSKSVGGWYITATQNFAVATSSLSTSNIAPGTNSALTVTNGNGQVVGAGNVVLDVTNNALNQKGVVAGPTGSNGNQAWVTDGSGNPSWGSVSNAQLANSSITVNGATGLGVTGSPVSLGGTLNLSNTGVTSLTAGSGITLSSSTGGITVTNAAIPAANTITGSGTATRVAFFTGANTLSSTSTPANDLYWDNTNYRLGIGTATPQGAIGLNTSGANAIAWGPGPYSKIYDNGNIHYWTDDNATFESGATGTGAAWNWVVGQNATATATGTATWLTLYNSNLGIGNTSPNAKLDINGSQLINGNLTNASARPAVSAGTMTNGELRGYSASGITADDGFLRVSAGAGTTAGTKSYIDLSGYNAGGTSNDMYENIVLGTAGTERMRILYNGNVGIGTTNPVNKLQVEGNIHLDGHSIYFRTGPTDTYDFIQWGGITGGNDRVDIAGYNGVDLGYSSSGGAITTVLSVNGSNQVNIPGLAASSAVYTDASNNLTTTAPTGGGLNWATTGNTGTTPTSYADGSAQTNNFMGTTDNQPLFIYTNSSSGNNKSNVELYNATSTTNAAVASSDIFHIRRNGQGGVSYPQVVSFALGKYTAGINSLTQADIRVGNGSVYTPDVTVMSLLGNGNVGIGTTSPGNNLLNVSTSSTQATANTAGAGINMTGQTGNGSGGGGAISLTAGNGGSGGVGGGVTIVGGTNGTSTFGGGGSVSILGGTATAGSYGVSGGNINLTAGSCYNAGGSGAGGSVNITAGGNMVGNTPYMGNINFNTYANSGITASEAMIINGSNNYVGIGTTSPAYLLDVANSARFSNGGGTYVYVGNGGGGYYGDGTNLVTQIPTGGSFYMANTGTDGTRVSQSDGTLRVGGPSQGSSNLYVYGEEGIGTTSPGYTLDINGKTGIDGGNDGAIYMTGTKNTYHGIEWNYGSNDRYGMAQSTGGNTALYTSAAYGPSFISFNLANAYTSAFTELARITHAGYMGIGTTAPNWKLDVAGSIGIANNNNSSTNRLYLASGDNNHYIYSSGTSGNQMYFGEYSNFNFVNTGSGNTVMDIAGANVGIGTTSPNCPLDVEAVNSTFNENSYRWFANSGSGTNTASCGSCNVSIYTPNRIEAAEFDATSDRRIKKNILSQPLAGALDEAMRLRVVTFNYIDQIQKGNKTKTGFIAQEVEGVLPNAVNHDIGFIPNVFQAPVKTALKGNILTVTTAKAHDFAKGDEIRIYDINNQSHDVMVSRVNNPNEFVINGWSNNADSLFVYGKEVDDYRNVDFDQITAISIGAVQQLNKKVKALEVENASLKEQNQQLNSTKANTEDVNARFSQMKAQLDDLKLLMEKNGIRSDK